MSLDLRSCAVGAAAGAAVVLGALAVHGALARGGRDAAVDSASGGGFAKKTREGEDVRSTTASGTYLGGSGSSVYESARAVGEYLAFHYAPPEELCPFPTCAPTGALDFTLRLAALATEAARTAGFPLRSTADPQSGADTRVLDLGCAVGGASFALSRTFGRVVGLDYSQAFVDAANALKAGGSLPYTLNVEGDIKAGGTAVVPADVDRSRVEFVQGDACNLPASLGKFHVILGANLLCRLPDPAKFLADVERFLVPGGVLVLVSPFSWLPEYTPHERWVGGTLDAGGKPVPSAATLRRVMDPAFELLAESDAPFLIREHARKYQYGISHVTVFKLR